MLLNKNIFCIKPEVGLLNFFLYPYKIFFSSYFSLFLLFLLVGNKSFGQTADFTFTTPSGTFCAPAKVSFNPTFSEVPVGFNWRFGTTGAESVLQNPTFSYAQPGSYKVVFTVLFYTKLVEVEKNIVISGLPAVSIIANKTFLCKPDSIHFTGRSNVPLQSLTWDFDDGNAPVITNDTGIINNFITFKLHRVRLRARDINGCQAQAVIRIDVRNITINNLSANPTGGCIPANVRLRAGAAIPAGTTVAMYIWNFGDGSPNDTTSINRINHRYTTTATVVPQVTVVTSEGCTNAVFFDSLFFGNRPRNLVLKVPKKTYCFSEDPVFFAKADSANEYRWNFGDGTILTTSDTTVTHQYRTRNSFLVRVTPLYNGCAGASDTVTINIIGPQADFSFVNTCTNRASFNFTNTSLGVVDSIIWRFGSGGSTSILSNPGYTFPAVGSYNVRMYVYQNSTGCSDVLSRTIFSTAPVLVPSDSATCIGQSASLGVSTPYNNNAARYTFSLGGRVLANTGSSFRNIITDSIGSFINSIVVDDGPSYCKDTLFQNYPFYVRGPLIRVSAPASICISDSFRVTNTSSAGFSEDTLINWLWNFGDSIHYDSLPDPLPFVYSNPGTYQLSLTIFDLGGCTSTQSLPVTVRSLPLLIVNPPAVIACPNEVIPLNAIHQGIISWLPAGGTSCDTCSMVTIQTAISSRYTAIALDPFGCSSRYDVPVSIQAPYIFNDILRDTMVCAGQPVFLDAGTRGLVYNWTPASELSATNIPNPIAIPLGTTTYRVNFLDSAGCFPDSADVLITISPQPSVNAGPDLILDYNSPFNLNPAYSPDVSVYKWTPGGQLNCNNCANPTGRALVTGYLIIAAENIDGCNATDSLLLTIKCDPANMLMPTAFTPNGDNLNDFFYPLTRGVAIIKRFQIFSRYGQMIYEKYNIRPNDRAYGWDGTINGKPQDSGNFIYIIDAECDQGNTISTKGSVMLLR